MKTVRKPVHPGRVFFEDVLLPLNLSLTNAAAMMGITRKALSEFVNGKTSCSPRMAVRIAIATHTSAESWLAMQGKLDLWKARQNNFSKLQRFPKIAASA